MQSVPSLPVWILVTGGAGYIGSIVARRLRDCGDEVAVLDSMYRGHRSAIPDGVRSEHVDLLDLEATGRVLARGFDGVLHLAALALVAESVAQPERYYRGNVVASLNLLEAGVRRLVFLSTCAPYGEPATVPIAENTPPAPVNSYGNSKLAVDRMLVDEARAHGAGAISLRYFNVAGASGPHGEDHEPETHRMPLVLRAAVGRAPAVSVFGADYPTPDRSAVRDYMHVEDLGRAHLLAFDRVTPGRHEIFSLGAGRGHSVREVIVTARAVTGIEIPVREEPRRAGDPPNLVAATVKAHDELGWRPEKTLEDMVRDAREWSSRHPAGY